MATATELGRARQCFERHDWRDAFTRLSTADAEEPLEPEDLARLAAAAFLLGHDAESYRAGERAFHEYLRLGDAERAAWSAFWLALRLLLRGELARSGGWFARAQRIVDDGDLDCVTRGYLLTATGIRSAQGEDFLTAYDLFTAAVEIGARFGDADLVAMARHGQGRAMIGMGDAVAGLSLLDEVMAEVTAGELSAIPAGMIYCSVIEVCQEVADLRRAQEWTAALSAWCAAQPGLVPFRGQCLVHRTEVLRLRGAWAEALAEIERACLRLADPPGQPALGLALYQQAELHRLRGELQLAEQRYGEASERGYPPQPGLALLRLAQGRTAAAVAAIRHAADGTLPPRQRALTLAARVEIMLAAGDTASAGTAGNALAGLAAVHDASLLRALSAHAEGALRLADGDPVAAVGSLRAACRLWAEVDAPYEGARSHILLGLAFRGLGDDDTARFELDAARRTLLQLGAAPGVAGLREPAPAACELTGRELQVLALVAAGRSNREIAGELVISEHTVRRHLQNAFAKLGVSSRAAATTYVVQHHLV
ncbi:helix-turn-helix transcriptional regulator [Prauserella sp. PE36]|uniref:DNA-binding response regulator n=1 Tax=Prauserella endophytica TaxID=1592324 RepID=A0ABY2S3E3_9PSEU|nr:MULTISPECIES: LuxR family transcriptional regulator [Prauserella]RBM23849.1 helix-turn-helix transcriptional regulator [Prauserella sp. PE36]TKG69118.1 DNA-binding response regulator [Prauserella endophytica]